MFQLYTSILVSPKPILTRTSVQATLKITVCFNFQTGLNFFTWILLTLEVTHTHLFKTFKLLSKVWSTMALVIKGYKLYNLILLTKPNLNLKHSEPTQSGRHNSAQGLKYLLIANLMNHHHVDEIKSSWTQLLKCPASQFNQ